MRATGWVGCGSGESDKGPACWPFALGAPSMGAHLRVQVPLRAGHSEQSEAQLREGD